MAYPTPRPLSDKYYNVRQADISTAEISYVPIAAASILQDAYVTISAAITVANSVVTLKKGSTTLGTITIVQSGSAIGSTFQVVLSGSEIARTFAAGDTLIIDGDGGSTTTSVGQFVIVMREL